MTNRCQGLCGAVDMAAVGDVHAGCGVLQGCYHVEGNHRALMVKTRNSVVYLAGHCKESSTRGTLSLHVVMLIDIIENRSRSMLAA